MKVPYKIYRDPLPRAGSRRRTKYPFAELSVGECFYVPVEEVMSRASLDAGARMWAKRNGKHWKFAVRKVKDSYGVWRVK